MPSLTALVPLALVPLLLLTPLALPAQESAADCAEIEDDRERLACFDRIFSRAEPARPKAESPAPAASPPAVSGRRGEPVAEIERRGRERSRARASAPAAEADTEAKVSAWEPARQADSAPRPNVRRTLTPDARGRMSMPHETRPDNPPDPERNPEQAFGFDARPAEFGGDRLRTRAVGDYGLWKRGVQVELENGQVWEVIDRNEVFNKATNPEVRIERGLFSAFYLHIEGTSRSLRVRRVK